jgi:hypothetical protein
VHSRRGARRASAGQLRRSASAARKGSFFSFTCRRRRLSPFRAGHARRRWRARGAAGGCGAAAAAAPRRRRARRAAAAAASRPPRAHAPRRRRKRRHRRCAGACAAPLLPGAPAAVPSPDASIRAPAPTTAAQGGAAALPPGVTRLRPLPFGASSPVYLIGTSHVAPSSAADVEALIFELRCALRWRRRGWRHSRATALMLQGRPQPRKQGFVRVFARRAERALRVRCAVPLLPPPQAARGVRGGVRRAAGRPAAVRARAVALRARDAARRAGAPRPWPPRRCSPPGAPLLPARRRRDAGQRGSGPAGARMRAAGCCGHRAATRAHSGANPLSRLPRFV